MMIIKIFKIVSLLGIVLLSTKLWAYGEKIIELTANECSVSISIPGGSDCDAEECSGDNTCVCASKGEHIKWTLEGGEAFKLRFSGDSPLKENCGKNFKKDKHKCVVKTSLRKGDSFIYDIKLKSCANGTDPKIVIK